MSIKLDRKKLVDALGIGEAKTASGGLGNILKPIKVNPAEAITIREAEGSGEGYWVGAPTIYYELEKKIFWLCYRWRNPTDRGHTAVIAKSTDGINFTDVWSKTKADFGADIDSIERASLIKNPLTGKYQYFICLDTATLPFKIYKLADADDPTLFDPTTYTLVIDVGASGEWDDAHVKDPKVFSVAGRLFMLYCGHDGTSEQGGIAYSIDGETWTKYANNPINIRGASGSWKENHNKVDAVLARGGGWLLYYSANSTTDPTALCRTGLLAWIPPMTGTPVDLTPNAPFLEGTDPSYPCFKYPDVAIVGSKMYIYYEHGQPDGSFDLVVNVVDLY